MEEMAEDSGQGPTIRRDLVVVLLYMIYSKVSGVGDDIPGRGSVTHRSDAQQESGHGFGGFALKRSHEPWLRKVHAPSRVSVIDRRASSKNPAEKFKESNDLFRLGGTRGIESVMVEVCVRMRKVHIRKLRIERKRPACPSQTLN